MEGLSSEGEGGERKPSVAPGERCNAQEPEVVSNKVIMITGADGAGEAEDLDGKITINRSGTATHPLLSNQNGIC